MKLFYVKDTRTNKHVKLEGAHSPYFDDKKKAKALRDELNGDNNKHYCVARGPDNLASARGFPPKMRRQPR